MSFSYVIKVDAKYIAIDSKTSDKSLYWFLVDDRKSAMIMSEEFAYKALGDVQIYFTTAAVVGINYEQN